MYEIPLADLSMYGAEIGVMLMLHDCPPILVSFKCAQVHSFPTFLRMGWLNGILLKYGRDAKQPSDISIDELMAEAQSLTLDSHDPLYVEVTDYDAFQTMRERMRRLLVQLDTLPPPRRENAERWMSALHLWLMLHRMTGLERPGTLDPRHANTMRYQMRRALQEDGKACFTIACSANNAYVQTVGVDFTDLSEVVDTASTSVRPFSIGRPRETPKRRPPRTRH